MVPVTLVVTDDAIPTGTALEDVVVRVYSEDGVTFVTEGQTDEDGELVLDLEDATTYWVRFFKIGYRFESQRTIDVDSAASSNTFDVEATDLTTLPPSAVPELCRASGYVRGPGLAPRPGIRFTFTMTGNPRVVAGQVIVVEDLIARSDADGWIEVELVRTGVYDCVVDGRDDVVFRVVVPDRSAVSITELVWPYVAALEYSTDEVEIEVGEETEVEATVTLSSGVETPYELDDGTPGTVGTFVTLSVEDEDIASATLDGATLTVVGKAAGTTTVTASVQEDVEAARYPEPTRALATLTITVTA